MTEGINALGENITYLWKNEVVLRLAIAVVTAIVTSLLTHVFDSKKMRKQQDIAFQDSLGKVIYRPISKPEKSFYSLRR